MSVEQSVDALCQEARGLIKQKEYTKAIAVYQEALKREPRSVAIHEALATCLFIIKDYSNALEHFRKVTHIDPKQSRALVNIGAVYNRQQDYNNAIKALRQALAKDRRCAEAYYNLGIAHKGLKQYGMAVSAYKETIRLDPEMPEAYQNLANCLAEMGNVTQAITNYRRALELRPSFEAARVGLERAMSQADAAKKAISPFGRLVDVQQMGSGVHQVESRELSPQERFEDRLALHRLSKDMESAAAKMLNQLREDVSPILLRLTHAFAQGATTTREFDIFLPAAIQLRDTWNRLYSISNELREHEQKLHETRGAT
jgi:tetratricopeptide (TPR) repeat protein